MSVPGARVLRGEQAAQAECVGKASRDDQARARVVRAELLEATQRAEAIVREARARAELIVQQARAQAQQQADGALEEARAQARAELATSWVRLRAREARADEAAADRSIAVARLLAERVIGQQLSRDPDLLAPMAREALAHFWRAEAITVRACASDIEVLQRHGAQLGVRASILRFELDESCGRGTLRIRTPQGSLDTDVALQLERLVEALRQGTHGEP